MAYLKAKAYKLAKHGHEYVVLVASLFVEHSIIAIAIASVLFVAFILWEEI